MRKWQIVIAIAVVAGTVSGMECGNETAADLIGAANWAYITNGLSAEVTWGWGVATNGYEVSVDPEHLTKESLTNAAWYAWTNGLMWGEGQTGIVCTVTSEVETNETDADLHWGSHIYHNGMEWTVPPVQWQHKPTHRTVIVRIERITRLRFDWMGETWTAKHIELISESRKRLVRKEEWVEE